MNKYFLRRTIEWVICLFCLVGCTIEKSSGPVDINTADRALCQYFWLEEFEEGTINIPRQFIFEEDGSGVEVWRFSYANYHKLPFNWEWADEFHRTILLRYGDTSMWMEDVFIMDNVLTCRMEGEEKSFQGVRDYL